jgi:BlaI family penicillinase repressor
MITTSVAGRCTMKKLSDSELDIMLVIWRHGAPISFDEIAEAVKEQNWTESTVRNFLARIVNKGYLKIEKDGRRNLYIPLVSESYVDRKSTTLLDRLYDGSVKHFVARLYENDEISQEDILELRRYLDTLVEEDDA